MPDSTDPCAVSARRLCNLAAAKGREFHSFYRHVSCGYDPVSMTRRLLTFALLVLAYAPGASAQSGENVAVVINDLSPESQKIGMAYVSARSIPSANVLHIRTATTETVDRVTFIRTIAGPIVAALAREGLQDRVLYIVLTKGIPLRVNGTVGQNGTMASVDSEITLLYRGMAGEAIRDTSVIANPYYLGDRDITEARPFTHHGLDIFLVSRLDAYTVDEAMRLIEKGASPQAGGKVVLDQRDALVNRTGETWLELAAERLAAQGLGEQVVLETTPKPARGITDVIGYFSWGSTDPQNRVRTSGMSFAPGAIAAAFVGSDARTFREPSAAWIPTGDANNRTSWHEGSPESLVGDLIREGVTGAAGYVSQPFLNGTIRPQILFPAYAAGFNLVEAFYLAMPFLSWQTIVIGDPLTRPFPRKSLSRAEIEEGFDPVTELPALFSKQRMAIVMKQSPGIPERAVALRLRAEYYTIRGDTNAARAAIDDAIELAPRFTLALLQRASLEEAADRRDAAMKTYEQVLEIDPNQVVALNNLAHARAVYGKMPKEALPLAERAVAQAPGSPVVLETLAWIQHLLGDSARAAKTMEAVARANLPNPEVRLHAAIVFAAAGSRGLAQKELALALKLDPKLADDPKVKELQRQLAP